MSMKRHIQFSPQDVVCYNDTNDNDTMITIVFLLLLYVVRIKNMFLFDEQQAEKQFHYRTVMINWLFTPQHMTYKDLAATSMELWNEYLDYEWVPGFGSKDPSESWEIWCVMRQPYIIHPTP